MYKALTLILVVIVGVSGAARSHKTPSTNLQRLTPSSLNKDVNVDLCPLCINEAVAEINVLLNLILNQGIVDSCEHLCAALANKTGSKFAGDVCEVACDGLGIDEFIHEIIRVDLDPIWYCEMAHMCEINDHGDATFTNFGVYPSTGPQGTTFVIDCSFKTVNGTGTSMLTLDITDSHNNTDSNDFLVDSKTPGIYAEKIGYQTLTAMHCDRSKGFCDDFPVGIYNVTAQFCNGECGSHHPHSSTYVVGKASFTVTKKK